MTRRRLSHRHLICAPLGTQVLRRVELNLPLAASADVLLVVMFVIVPLAIDAPVAPAD